VSLFRFNKLYVTECNVEWRMNEEIRQTKNDFFLFRSNLSYWSDGILDKLLDDLRNDQLKLNFYIKIF